MLRKKIRKSQGGFTLIEIIAVLVILGILAAVAVPRFLDLQTNARTRALDGACAAFASNINLAFAQNLLTSANTSTALAAALANAPTDLGDFTASGLSNPTVATATYTFTVTHDAPDNYSKTCTAPNPAYNQ